MRLKFKSTFVCAAFTLALIPTGLASASPEPSPYRLLDAGDASTLVDLELADEPSPETHGVSPLEFAAEVRANAKKMLGSRFVELWMAENQKQLVVGALGVSHSEAALLGKELSDGVSVAVERREVSRTALDGVYRRLEEKLPERVGMSIARNYERGLVDVSAANQTQVDRLRTLLSDELGIKALTGQAAREANELFPGDADRRAESAREERSSRPSVSVSISGSGHTFGGL